jgi:hypothetical protein
VKLALDLPAGEVRRQLTDSLSQYAFVRLESGAPDLILYLNTSDSMRFFYPNGETIWRKPVPAGEHKFKELTKEILEAAWDLQKARFLRSLENSDENLDIQLEMLPVTDPKTKATGDHASKLDAFGNLRYRLGDHFYLRITNRSDQRLYFQVLDIQPDDRINQLVPIPGFDKTARDYFLEPGQSQKIDYLWKLYPPAGKEVFKLIASRQPLDLSRFLASWSPDRTRGGDDAHQLTLPEPTLHISTVIFELEE